MATTTTLITTAQQLIKAINTNNNGQGFHIGWKHSDTFQQCADLDGTHARQWLESLGFTVVENGDNGRNGFAITSTGIYLSTNGFVHYLRNE